jgi:pimeloyl-ACP methyl ester carboxylesterase
MPNKTVTTLAASSAPTRQTLLAVAAAALLTLSGTAIAQPRPNGATRNIVIAHGAYVDGSGWRAVYDILEKDGYHVTIVQEPLTGLADDVAATKRVLDLQDGPVVLVGHSYGGSVISIAGADPKVTRLVYVAGLQPDVGETAGQLLAKFPDRNTAVQPAGEGYLRLDPAKFPATFAADVDPAEARFMAASQVPIATAAFGAQTTAAAWRTKPSYAILTAHDIAANPDLQRWMYERSGSKVTTVEASHAVYISQPKIVAHVIEEAATSTARAGE